MNKDEMKMIEDMARFPIYAGCSIIGEDEIGIKKSELARLKNLEINYEQVYEDYRKLEQERKNYRKVGEDEVVLTKGAYESISNKAKANVVKALEIKQEAVREVLQKLFPKEDMSTDTTVDLDKNGKWVKREINYFTIYEDEVKDLAKEYGIESED